MPAEPSLDVLNSNAQVMAQTFIGNFSGRNFQ